MKCLVDSDCRGDDTCQDNECIRRSELIEALVDDNGVLEWFFLEEVSAILQKTIYMMSKQTFFVQDEDECASSANADSAEEISIQEAREGRKRGKKGPKLPALREAREEACADVSNKYCCQDAIFTCSDLRSCRSTGAKFRWFPSVRPSGRVI